MIKKFESFSDSPEFDQSKEDFEIGSNCGWINQDLTLSIREWICPSCDEIHDRDFNASKNILKQGLKILSGSGIESDIKQKQVEALPLGESMKPETH